MGGIIAMLWRATILYVWRGFLNTLAALWRARRDLHRLRKGSQGE